MSGSLLSDHCPRRRRRVPKLSQPLDAAAVPWMHKFNRNPVPQRIVWKQDDVTRKRFYWLAVPSPAARSTTTVSRAGNTVNIEASTVDKLIVRLNDQMLDMNEKVVIKSGEKKLFEGIVPRTAAVIASTLADFGDRSSVYRGEVTVDLRK